MSASLSVLQQLAQYCDELAPVVGPLLSNIAETARAVVRVQQGTATGSRPSLAYQDAAIFEKFTAPPATDPGGE